MSPELKWRRVLWLIVLFGLGIAASSAQVTAIIHEFCHIFAAYLTGGSGRLVDWTHCATKGIRGFEFVRYAGFFGEMIVYLILFGIITIWKQRTGGMFWLGAAHHTYLIAHGRRDFYTWSDLSGRDWNAVRVVGAFYIIFGLLLFMAWVLFVGREILYWRNYSMIQNKRQPIRSLEDIRKRFG